MPEQEVPVLVGVFAGWLGVVALAVLVGPILATAVGSLAHHFHYKDPRYDRVRKCERVLETACSALMVVGVGGFLLSAAFLMFGVACLGLSAFFR